MSRCPAGSHDAHDFHSLIVAVRVDDRQKSASTNDTHGMKPILAIFEPAEMDPRVRVLPWARGDFERNAMLGLIGPVLRLVPFELNGHTT